MFYVNNHEERIFNNFKIQKNIIDQNKKAQGSCQNCRAKAEK